MSDKYIRQLRRMALDGTLDTKTAEALLRARDGDWNEGDHPRGKGGKFVRKGSGTSSGGGESSSGSSQSTASAENMKEPASSYVNHPPRQSFKAQVQRKAVERANRSMAKECARRAQQWPKGSEERGIYERYSKSLSEPFTPRPTPEESKAMTQKFLSNISSKLKPYAVDRYKKDLANEPQITSDLCDIADEIGTGMHGLGYRLKKASDNDHGVCRIDEKIRGDIKDIQDEAAERGEVISDEDAYKMATDNLSDMVRYTQACTKENLVDNFEKTKAALEKKGYKVKKVKNTWKNFNFKKPYRGVNCVFESPTGTRFELQFHTAESLVGKEVQHPWYEEFRTDGTPEQRKQELAQRMYDNMSKMAEPIGIERIKDYPPKTD